VSQTIKNRTRELQKNELGQTLLKEGEWMVKGVKVDKEYIDDIILEHIKKNTRALQRTLYQVVETNNRSVRREAIGRRINTLEREGRIFIIRQIAGENLYGLSK
jgi:hypothetical protein